MRGVQSSALTMIIISDRAGMAAANGGDQQETDYKDHRIMCASSLFENDKFADRPHQRIVMMALR
jgi:hypothetical protein